MKYSTTKQQGNAALIVLGVALVVTALLAYYATREGGDVLDQASGTQAQTEINKFAAACIKYEKITGSTAGIDAATLVQNGYLSSSTYIPSGAGSSSNFNSLAFTKPVSFAPSGNNTTCTVNMTTNSASQCQSQLANARIAMGVTVVPTCSNNVLSYIVD